MHQDSGDNLFPSDQPDDCPDDRSCDFVTPVQEPAPPCSQHGSADELSRICRNLRYDGPVLEIPPPLYLRTKDDQSDDEAA